MIVVSTLVEEEADLWSGSDLGTDSSSDLNPSELLLPFPTANPESYRKSNLSCLLQINQFVIDN